jgi:outer membrane biosynthesis protein TonB
MPLDEPASSYIAPVLLVHSKPDFSSCGELAAMQLVITLSVDKNGAPGNIKVVRGYPEKCENDAAVAAVKLYRFTPEQERRKPAVTNIALGADTEEPAEEAPLPSASGSSKSRVTPPLVVKAVEPDPPRWAGNTATNVNVLVHVMIGTNGVPAIVRTVTDRGNKDFAAAAERAVSQYRFRPAQQDGHPVQVELQIDISFR